MSGRLSSRSRKVRRVLRWHHDRCLFVNAATGKFSPDPRITATIAAIEGELSEDSMVRRKPTKGQNQQGSFIACTFWLADCQHMQGRHTDARRTVERVLAVRNDVGLLS